VLAGGMAPTSGGTTSFAFLFLAGEGSVGLAGDEAYACTTWEPFGVAKLAFVVRGAAGRVMGSEGENEGAEEKILAPAGVGVNGGGFSGDSASDIDFDAALRFLGSGVAGRDEAALASPLVALLPLVASGDVGAGALVVLRFLGGTLALPTFSYFATPFWALTSNGTGVLLLATRAERLKDML
jgi:hypothetical protein